MRDYYESFKKSKWFPLVMGVIFIIIGIFCVMNPHIQMENLAMIIAVIFLVYALFQIITGILTKDNQKFRIMHIAVGIVVLVFAVLIFANKELVGKYLPTLVGFFMIIFSVSALFQSITLWKNNKSGWWLGVILAVIILVLGLVFLLKPGFVGQAFGLYTGITLLINGASNILSFIQLKSST